MEDKPVRSRLFCSYTVVSKFFFKHWLALIRFIITEESRRLLSSKFRFIIHGHGRRKCNSSGKWMQVMQHILNICCVSQLIQFSEEIIVYGFMTITTCSKFMCWELAWCYCKLIAGNVRYLSRRSVPMNTQSQLTGPVPPALDKTAYILTNEQWEDKSVYFLKY